MTMVEEEGEEFDALERRLRAAFADARASVHEHPDLFARVTRSLEEMRARRRFRIRLVAGVLGFLSPTPPWRWRCPTVKERSSPWTGGSSN